MQHFEKDKIEKSAVPLNGSCASLKPALLRVEIVESRDAILALEVQWRALEALCPNTVLFQSFDWCRNHLLFHVERSGKGSKALPGFNPMVFSVFDGDELVALLPLCLKINKAMRVLTGFSEPFQQYTEVLLKPGYNIPQTADLLIAAMKGCRADYFHFGQVREDGDLAKLLDGHVAPSGERDAAPYVAITDHENHAAYLQTINSKTRKNLRNLRNRLEREAPVEHMVARDGPLMREVIERAYEGREAWLERLGITSRAFRDEDFKSFLVRFGANEKTTGIDTIAMSLKHGGVAISDQWGFVYRGRYYAFMATWNPDYEMVSPGRLHLGEVIQTAFDKGIKVADFMIPAVSYKMTWTDKAASVSDYVLPLSVRGRIYNSLWLDFARPLSKKILFSLPAGIRGFIVKKVVPGVE